MANVASQRAVNRANLCTDERRECVVLLMSRGYLRITPYLGSNCNRQPGSLTAMSTRLNI
ncbi:hypothetical protein V1478_017531 [Vespula squamosa]|uniref:Uncharacterized protein n=1 Tax=Vespula squamosa TaxID=30214 RepID=A0ABD1ZZP7_VESSQ